MDLDKSPAKKSRRSSLFSTAASSSPENGRKDEQAKLATINSAAVTTEAESSEAKRLKRKKNKKKKKMIDGTTAGREVGEKTLVDDPAAASSSHVEKDDDIDTSNKGEAELQYDKKGNRKWTPKLEIKLLKRLITFVDKGNKVSKKTEFYNSIHGSSIAGAFRQDLVTSKIRHTKAEYLENRKQEMNGDVLKFPTLHKEKLYNMSKLVWKDDDEPKSKSGVKRKSVAVDAQRQATNEVGFGLIHGNDQINIILSMPEMVLSEKVLKMIGASKVVEMTNHWNKLKVAEKHEQAAHLEAFRKVLNVVRDSTVKVLEELTAPTSEASTSQA